MSEETDALNNRIRVLENQVADMQRLVQDTSDLLDIARANGLDKFLTGHGFWQSQGGIMQFDLHGIQITPTASQNVAIFFVPSFSTDPAAQNGVGEFYGDVLSNYVDVGLVATSPDGTGSVGIVCLAHNSASSRYVQVDGAAFWLPVTTTDFTANQDGMLWYRSDTDKFRARANSVTENLATESYVTKESASAAAIATNGTITTANVTSARVAPTGAVTGVILQSGTTGGQTCTVVNEAVAANTVTFAASGTSHVADGTSSVVAGLNARRFIWDSSTSLWYPCK